MRDRRAAAGALVLALLVGSLVLTGGSTTTRVLAGLGAVVLVVVAVVLARRPAAPTAPGAGPGASATPRIGVPVRPGEALAVYGVGVDLTPDELGAAERGEHPLCAEAAGVGLEHHAMPGQLYLGRRLARLGVEHELHVVHDATALRAIRAEVDAALARIGRGAGRVHLHLLTER